MRRELTLLCFTLFSLAGWSQPAVNGDLSDPDYSTVATKQNSNMGFGPATDVTEIVYYSDPGSRHLYVGVKGTFDNATNNGIGLLLNLTGSNGLPGAPPCSPLGWAVDEFGNTPGHYMSANGGNDPFFADFEVDLMFAFNPGASTTNCFADMTSVVSGNPVAFYLGNCGQSGVPVVVNDPTTGLAFRFAFQNGGGNQGIELGIDYSSTTLLPDDMEAFAFIVSNTAFFSDVTVPGNATGGNPGFGPDFCSLTGGPWHSTLVPVPVELTYFTAEQLREEVLLRWATATEENSDYFGVQRSQDLENWETLGELQAAGYSLEERIYSFTDYAPLSGVNYYRLEQVDLDGTISYSPLVSVQNTTTPNQGTIFPNPVEEELIISLDEAATVVVYDSAGRVVFSRFVPAGQSDITLGDWHAGLYWIQARTDRGSELIREILIVK